MKMQAIRTNILVLILVIVMTISLFGIGKILFETERSKRATAEIQKVYSIQSEKKQLSTEALQENPIIRPHFYELLEINEDIVGWVKIANTNINYPVVQGEDNEYYLNHNIDKQQASSGTIFMDYRNAMSLDQAHTIIYGHRMKDGSMFGHLQYYLDEDFFRKYATISYETLTDKYDLEIFSVYVTTTDFDYIQTEFGHESDYDEFLHQIQEKSLYETETELTKDDHIFTLSTCDYTLDQNEGRLVVHAKVNG